MAFPTTAVLDSFSGGDQNPLNGTGNWSATEATSGTASDIQVYLGTATGNTGYSSAIWAISYANPLEFYLEKHNTSADDYYLWNVQPATIGGSGILDCYFMQIGSASTVTVQRNDNDSGTSLFSATSITHAAGDQWGISHAANGDIVLYQNGVVRGAGANDTTYTSGYLGFITSWTSANGIDDFGGDEVTTTVPLLRFTRSNLVLA